MTQRELNEQEQKIVGNVRKHGWHGMHVFDPDEASPRFSYTIGFPETLEAPEFIVFGLPSEITHSMLWGVFNQIRSGARPLHGRRWSGLLEGFDCVSVTANHDLLFTEYLTSARWFWKDSGKNDVPPVMQLVWPGSQDGLFPWEADCSETVIAAQPRLWTLPVS